MKGYLRVEDVSRSLITGHTRMTPRYQVNQHGPLIELELLVATELLRCTPRFWTGAAVWISRNELALGGYDAKLLSPENHPCHAQPSSRLWRRIYRLTSFVENNASPVYTDILVGVMWIAPRTWEWDSRYFDRTRGSAC